MVNKSWPRDIFGVDMNKAVPNARQSVGGSRVVMPTLIQLPDDAFTQILIITGGAYNLDAGTFGDILVNVAAPVTINLPLASNRNGLEVGIADIGGHAASFNITIVPAGADTIMGQSDYVIDANYGGITLRPISTGGWYVR